MNQVFADTSYYLALLNPHDVSHARAADLSADLRAKVVLTDFILLELGNSLSTGRHRQLFVQLFASLQSDPNVDIIAASQELLQAGFDLFARRADKQWSLTDCISFVVMQREGLTEALTADRHFEQAGFIALLK